MLKEFFLLYFVIIFTGCLSDYTNEEVNYYVDLIQNLIDNSENYTQPQDASMYKPKDKSGYKALQFGTFDFIIVGAGSAGCVVANRLSEVSEWSILLLEAGNFGNNLTNIPGVYDYLQASDYNWGFYTVPQQNCCQGMVDKKCVYPRGKGVGGTSLINGLLYSRGNKYDYDNWELQGNPGWSYKSVLPYFIKSENSHIFNDDIGYHGFDGPLNVEYHYPDNEQLFTFINSHHDKGLPTVDYNGNHEGGVAKAQTIITNGKRGDAGTSFIKPIIHRQNLLVQINSYVSKIIFDNKTAIGVEFFHGGQKYQAFVNKEVIVSAGAIQSPQILQLSGIGKKNDLKLFDIPVVSDLSVGENLIDHAYYLGMAFTMDYAEPNRTLRELVKEHLFGIGQLSVAGNNKALSFWKSNLNVTPDYPDIELLLATSVCINSYSQKFWGYNDETNKCMVSDFDPNTLFNIYVYLLRPDSRGTIKLQSSNPFDYPLIDLKLLTDSKNRDFSRIYEGIKIVQSLLETDAFKSKNVTLHAPALPACNRHKYRSEEYWYCTIYQITSHGYHVAGTCKMGFDSQDGAVVDHKLRVHGTKNLRVADDSIMPSIVSGHTYVPALMIGEKAADMIKKDNGIFNQ